MKQYFILILTGFAAASCSDCIKCSDCAVAGIKVTSSKYEGEFCPDDFPGEQAYETFKKAASKVCECD